MDNLNGMKAYVVTMSEPRMAQFKAAWTVLDLPESSIVQWTGTKMHDKVVGVSTDQKNAVQDAYDKGEEMVAVFEDDAVPCDNILQYLTEEINVAKDRGDGLLRIGWIDIPPNPLQGNANAKIPGTHAWVLLSRDAMKDFLDHWVPANILTTFQRMTVPVNRSSRCLFVQYNAPSDGECISNKHYGWFASSSVLHGNTTFNTVIEALNIKQRI